LASIPASESSLASFWTIGPNGPAFAVSAPAARLFSKAKEAQDRGDHSEALKLLRRVRGMKNAKQTLINKANYEISCIHRRNGRLKRAHDGYTKLLERSDLAAQLRLRTQFDRGTTNMGTGNFSGAIEDYTEVLLSSDTIPGRSTGMHCRDSDRDDLCLPNCEWA
jgi:tetratricopeptide (TPR) repeat protein